MNIRHGILYNPLNEKFNKNKNFQREIKEIKFKVEIDCLDFRYCMSRKNYMLAALLYVPRRSYMWCYIRVEIKSYML